MRRVLNKKPATVSGTDAERLATLSKSALLDLATDLLRAAAGHADTECTAEETADIVNPTLSARGDRPLRIGGAV